MTYPYSSFDVELRQIADKMLNGQPAPPHQIPAFDTGVIPLQQETTLETERQCLQWSIINKLDLTPLPLASAP